MAFSSNQTRDIRRMATCGPLSKLAPGQGATRLYYVMKEKFGGTQKWKELMSADAIILNSLNSAYAYKDGDYYLFEAYRHDDGWKLCYDKNSALPEDEKTILRAHASLETRIRMTAAQSSQRAARNLECEEKISQLNQKLQDAERLIQHQAEEIKVMRQSYRMAHDTVKETTVAATRTSWTSALIVIFAIVFTMLMNPVNAAEYVTNCAKPVMGCYIDQTARPQKELDYWQFDNMCYGTTTTRINPDAINVTKMVNQCRDHYDKTMQSELLSDWCYTNIRKRMTPARCERRSLKSLVQDWWLENLLALSSIYEDNDYILTYFCQIFGVVTVFMGTDPIKTLPFYMLGLVMEVPTFALALALTLFPLMTVGFLAATLLCPAEWHMGLYISHWIIMTVYTYLVEKDLQETSYAILYSLFLPCWNAAVYVLKAYAIGPPAQMVMLAVSITMSIGIKYANTTVTVTTPEGTTTKVKRIEIFKKGLKENLLKAQSAVRGVIPEIMDKTKCIAQIETDIGTGVAFRFMNEIFTIGHVVGPCETAVLKWNGQSVRLPVKSRKPLFESCDELVTFKLPPEFQSMKPLRLSKLDSSDYMQMLSYDQTEIVTYTGWCIIDGNWLSNSFNTKAGDSGAPYVDRHGRLVGIHLGTQGIVGQGYVLINALKPAPQPPQLAPINEIPVFEVTRQEIPQPQPAQQQQIPTDEIATVVTEQCKQSLEEISEQLLERLVQGTKRSFSQMTSEMERITQENCMLKTMFETQQKQLEQQQKVMLEMSGVIEKLTLKFDQVIAYNKMEKFIEICNADVVDEEKKKGKNKKHATKQKFMKMKVLTEEQYRQMLEEGWSKEEIKDVVDQLREQAWLAYEMEVDDYTDDDEQLQNELDEYLLQQVAKNLPKAGVRTITTYDVVVEEAKRRIKNRVMTCPHCRNDFTGRHNIRQCKMIQEGRNIVEFDPKRAPKDQRQPRKRTQQPPKEEESKNGESGRKGTSQ
nr:MAG: nonstructural polyprotein [Astroviridae sp.]